VKTPPAGCVAGAVNKDWRLLGCRKGRALLRVYSQMKDKQLCVSCEPRREEGV
jgi:hypothetical protein